MKKVNDSFTFDNREVRLKEIDLIQSIIDRMSKSQSKIKTNCIFFLVLLVLVTRGANIFSIGASVAVSIITLYTCYRVDYHFLKTEKLYRSWYDFILEIRNDNNMEHLLCLNLEEIKLILDNNNYNLSNIYDEARKSWSLKLYKTLLIVIWIGWIIYVGVTLQLGL